MNDRRTRFKAGDSVFIQKQFFTDNKFSVYLVKTKIWYICTGKMFWVANKKRHYLLQCVQASQLCMVSSVMI